MRILLLMLAASVLPGCASTTTERLGLPPPRTVEHVDLTLYLGTWYEIASIPQRFQSDCTASQAEYALREDGLLSVINSCRKGTLNGRLDVAKGRARVVDKESNAKLEVSFFGPFWGDYWILELGEHYDYSVVGHPSRDYLWILCRQRAMAPQLYHEILGRLEAQGYETERLVKTLQPAPDA